MQFGLRTLFALMTLVAVCLGVFAARMDRAKKQAAAVGRVQALAGGVVCYALPDGNDNITYAAQVDHSRAGCFPRAWPPAWLERKLGIDFFANVIAVGSWTYKGDDGDMADFKSFPKIKEIHFMFAPHVTDEGLAHLAGLSHLERVRLYGSKITDEGVAKLKQSLPNCQVER
jgi:hypothetical protein